MTAYFNSRPSARGDGTQCGRWAKDATISIHAPPRGATPTRTATSGRPEYFNSRPSARGDFPLHSFTVDLLYFNSRPSARGDVPGNSACASALDFNSRPSARGDGGFGQGDAIEAISIHAPPRGATANVQPLLLGDKFQFTPLREGRLIPKEKWQFGRDFNSRPSARGDGAFQATTGCTPYFNSRPSARGDALYRLLKDNNIKISIHAPPRGATHLFPRQRLHLCRFQFTPLREGRHQGQDGGALE